METIATMVDKAVNAHRSVRSDLRSTETVLSQPSKKIRTAINRNASEQIRSAFAAPTSGLIGDLLKSRPWYRANEGRVRTNQDSPRDNWDDGGDHYLLKQMIANGTIPQGYAEHIDPLYAPTLHQALALAKWRGYTVPPKFLESRTTSYGENEAWCAAQSIVRGNAGACWVDDVGPRGREDLMVLHQTGQFIIPDPLQPKRVPYIADQLWIAVSPMFDSVRLIVVEIDGEHHLERGRQYKDARRDERLEMLGYEVYHVAGWWCRIDPFRVIADFLRAADLLPGMYELVAGQLQSIDDYQCALCERPMVRFDDDWIATFNFGHEFRVDDRFVHSLCAGEANDR